MDSTLQKKYQALLAAAPRRGSTPSKQQVTIKIDNRILLYMRDLSASLPKVITHLLREFLEANGVDLNRGHDLEEVPQDLIRDLQTGKLVAPPKLTYKGLRAMEEQQKEDAADRAELEAASH